jgi:translation elongation factor P/translation initiation factor 5A
MKVIASQLRKGNVVEVNDALYVILKAENFHPGKGTPVTQVDMRRISDGVKVSERWKTTDGVERAHVEERNFQFLYEDGEGYHFMDPESYEQVTATADIVGDAKVWLQDGMTLHLSIHNEIPIALELAAEGDRGGDGNRACGEGADGVILLQARDGGQWRARDGAAPYRRGHADRGDDRGCVLRRAGEGLSARGGGRAWACFGTGCGVSGRHAGS